MVFGSVARGADTEASDIDLLIATARATSYFDLISLTAGLDDLLGSRLTCSRPVPYSIRRWTGRSCGKPSCCDQIW
ncbi:nucleotidyltransferase family protein [Ornithinimicrobium faecis]|uniref:nucleotidyltransferase family protein n=1 Tax=Ornithinimicrobium faecis TaxID=2934158 RepID=UPI003CE4C78F